MEHSVPVKLKLSLADLPLLFKQAYSKLVHNDPLRMAGATAFFTSFALPFILIILTQFLSLIIDPLKIRRELFDDLSGVFGTESVREVINTLIAFRQLANNVFFTIVGVLFLLTVATTLLMIVKGSINQLWRIRISIERSFIKRLFARLQSVVIIVATGILITISIVAEAVKANMGKSLYELSPTVSFYFTNAATYFLSLLFVTLWFGILFRFLPDARPTWKIAFTGAFVTAILFTIGKYLLRLLLTYGNLNTLYGASASVVLILLFVFYSSLILYFGAAFTTTWADYLHKPIRPLHYATKYKVMKVKDD
jgi:membrane protein